MYKIIGGDGREYGPVTMETIREWVRGGRANAQTRVQDEASGAWQPLGALPDFADLFIPNAPPVIPVATEALLARDYHIDIGDCLSRGWDALKPYYGTAIGATALLLLINFALGLIHVPGMIASIILTGVLYGGYYGIFLKIVRGQVPSLTDLFAGFSLLFVPLMLAGVVMGMLTVLGLICLLLPGFYLIVAWSFTYFLIIDKKMDFWSAMNLSRRMVHKHWFALFGLGFVCLIVTLVGILLLGVGVLLTIPVATAAYTVAYEDIFNPKG